MSLRDIWQERMPPDFEIDHDGDGYVVSYNVTTDGGTMIILGFPTLKDALENAWRLYDEEKSQGTLLF